LRTVWSVPAEGTAIAFANGGLVTATSSARVAPLSKGGKFNGGDYL
jgi:hypothetical protein